MNRPVDPGAAGESGSGHNPLLKYSKSSLYVRFQETVHQETMATSGGLRILRGLLDIAGEHENTKVFPRVM